jgi:hypothetical protein
MDACKPSLRVRERLDSCFNALCLKRLQHNPSQERAPHEALRLLVLVLLAPVPAVVAEAVQAAVVLVVQAAAVAKVVAVVAKEVVAVRAVAVAKVVHVAMVVAVAMFLPKQTTMKRMSRSLASHV